MVNLATAGEDTVLRLLFHAFSAKLIFMYVRNSKYKMFHVEHFCVLRDARSAHRPWPTGIYLLLARLPTLEVTPG